MSIVDKVIAKIIPPESEEMRHAATEAARDSAFPGDWLTAVLKHHDQIRASFTAARAARRASDRTGAMNDLALILNGHSLAEEIVLYPALAQVGEKGHAARAYAEQVTAKMQMAELENLAPSTVAWRDKLKHIEGAVLHHMYEEENGWFLDLKDKAEHQDRLTRRYLEEFRRYMG